VVILVGNKTDLASKREVSTLEGQQAADHHNLPFIETSAKVRRLFSQNRLSLSLFAS
jgi:GTPase SAR1 family protein